MSVLLGLEFSLPDIAAQTESGTGPFDHAR
jgi:hypothetical protein